MYFPALFERALSWTGQDGPWLHWLVTDYSLAFPQGNILAKYTGPRLVFGVPSSHAYGGQLCLVANFLGVFYFLGVSPTKGTHRYIFLLFRHIAGTEMQVPTTERKQWPFEQFMALNRDHLQPIQMNFFYCDSS